MAVDPKEALGVLGYDPEAFETVDDFKAKVEEEWVKSAEAHLNPEINKRAFGKANGSMVAKAKQYAKQMGLDVEIKTDVASEAWETVMVAAETKFKSFEDQIKEAGKVKGNSKEVEELTRQYSELQKKFTDTDGLYKTAIQKYDELENGIKSEKMQAKVDGIYAKAEDGIKFKEGMSKYELDGFRAHIRRNFHVKFDDEGKEYVTDANGDRIKDAKKAAAFLDLATVIKTEAEKEKLTGTPQGGTPVRRTLPMSTPQTPQQVPPQAGARQARQVMPRQ